MRVVILGAGYAGLTVARQLERLPTEGVELLVVNDRPEHLIRHELHRTIRRPEFLDDLCVPLDELLADADVLVDRVDSIDPERGRTTLESNGTIEYDYAAICLGSETAFHDLPGVEAHANPFREPEHASEVRRKYLSLLEAGGSVAIGGAGLTGIQVAGELAELAIERESTGVVDILLLEELDTVAPGFSDRFQAAVRDALDHLGVDVRTGVSVTGASTTGVETDEGSVPAEHVIWTGGIGGPTALDRERPTVPPTLRLADGTFALGDAARVIDRDGQVVPASAQAAIHEARVAATNIDRLLAGPDPDGFEPRLETVDFSPLAWIVSVGDDAVAQVGPTVVRGQMALALKTSAGVGYLSRVGQVQRVADLVRAQFGRSTR